MVFRSLEAYCRQKRQYRARLPRQSLRCVKCPTVGQMSHMSAANCVQSVRHMSQRSRNSEFLANNRCGPATYLSENNLEPLTSGSSCNQVKFESLEYSPRI